MKNSNILKKSFIVFLLSATFINLSAQMTLQQTVPANGSTWETTIPSLSWLLYNSPGQVSFSVKVSLNGNDFSNPNLVINTTVNGSSVNSYQIPAGLLAVGTTYYWKIGYNNNYSQVWSFTPASGTSGSNPIILIAPTLTSPLGAAVNISLSPTLNWGAINGATSFRVQVSTSNTFNNTVFDNNNIASTSVSISGLNTLTTYYWRVRAQNSQGMSNWSDTFSFFTVPPIPGIPSFASPADNATNLMSSLNLIWNSSSNAASYTVQLALDPNFNSIVSTNNTLSSSFVVSSLFFNTSYYWRVSATNFTGTSNWSASRTFRTKMPPPLPPALLSPANNSSNVLISYLFQWNRGSFGAGVNSFKFQLSTSSNFSSNVQQTAGLTDTTKLVIGLFSVTQYYWRVKSYTATDSSDWSPIFAFTTSPPPRTIYVDAGSGNDGVQLGLQLPGDGTALKPYKTITYALSRLFMGGSISGADTIRVANGIYPEYVQIILPVVIIGSGNTKVGSINIGSGVNPNLTFAVEVKNIETTDLTLLNQNNPSFPGRNQGITIYGWSNVILDNVKVSNFSPVLSHAALEIQVSNHVTVRNSDFSNNYHGIYVIFSNNIVFDNITVNSNQLLNFNVLNTIPTYGLYMEKTSNIDLSNLIFNLNMAGCVFKEVNGGTINNLTITNTPSNLGFVALAIGPSQGLTFNGGNFYRNASAAIFVDPSGTNQSTNFYNYMPLQNSSIGVSDLSFVGHYKFISNYAGIVVNPAGIQSPWSVNGLKLDGDLTFSMNNQVNGAFWSSSDIYLNGKTSGTLIKGCKFITTNITEQQNNLTYGPTQNAIVICSIYPYYNPNSQSNGVVIDNCEFEQMPIIPFIKNQSPNPVYAHNNEFSNAASIFDVETAISDSLDFLIYSGYSVSSQYGRVHHYESTFGNNLPPTIGVKSVVTGYRGASYYLDVSIFPHKNNFNQLSGKFVYDASKLQYLGYLSDATGLINQKQWTTLSITPTVVHNLTPPDSGYIEFTAFGNNPINTNGTLFKLNMKVLANAAGANQPSSGNPGSTQIIGYKTNPNGTNNYFKGNNQPVFNVNPGYINYFDPIGIPQAKGDVNLDGIVTMDDFMALLYYLLGSQPITDPQALSNADFNIDSQVNQLDLNALFLFVNPGAGIVNPRVVSASVSLPNISLSQNSSVTVPVSINNALNINSLQLILHYDQSKIGFQAFAAGLQFANQFVHGFESKPGEAVFVLESPSTLNGTINPGSIVLKFVNGTVPDGSVITTRYRINGNDLKTGPSFTFANGNITGVEKDTEIPAEYSLSQNYPNPFNPSTVISYSLPTNSFVTLKVFDLLGREVKTLVNNDVFAGKHTVRWNGEDNSGKTVSAGVYVYRVAANNFVSSKKMILLK